MSRTRTLDRYNMGLMVLKDITNDDSDPTKYGMVGCEAQYYHANKSDNINYGEVSYGKIGYIGGYTYLTQETEDKKLGKWYTCAAVVKEKTKDGNGDMLKTPDWYSRRVEQEDDIEVNGKKKTTVKSVITHPVSPDMPIPLVQPGILVDDKYFCQAGPMVLHMDKPESSWQCVNGYNGWGYLRNCLTVAINPAAGATAGQAMSSRKYQAQEYDKQKKQLEEDKNYYANKKKQAVDAYNKQFGSGGLSSPGSIYWDKKSIDAEKELLDIKKKAERTKFDLPETVAFELGEAPDGEFGYGMIAWSPDKKTSHFSAEGGEYRGFVTGKNCTKHQFGKDGYNHTPAHIHTGGYFFMDPEKDGALNFEKGKPPEGKDAGSPKKVHCEFNGEKWIWWTTDVVGVSEPSTTNPPFTPPDSPENPPTSGGDPSKPVVPVIPKVPGHIDDLGDVRLDDGRNIPRIKNENDDKFYPSGATQEDIDRLIPKKPVTPVSDPKPTTFKPFTEIPNSNGEPAESLPNSTGRKPGAIKSQVSSPSYEGAPFVHELPDPDKANSSNSEYRAQSYNKADFDNGLYAGDVTPYHFDVNDWQGEILAQKDTKKPVLSYTMAAWASEANKAITRTSNRLLGFDVPADLGGVFFAPADCSNQNPKGTLGEDSGSKSQLLMHPKRSSVAFGYPRETNYAEASIYNVGADNYLKIDVSNIQGLILTGLPASPSVSKGLWVDAGTVRIEP